MHCTTWFHFFAHFLPIILHTLDLSTATALEFDIHLSHHYQLSVSQAVLYWAGLVVWNNTHHPGKHPRIISNNQDLLNPILLSSCLDPVKILLVSWHWTLITNSSKESPSRIWHHEGFPHCCDQWFRVTSSCLSGYSKERFTPVNTAFQKGSEVYQEYSK